MLINLSTKMINKKQCYQTAEISLEKSMTSMKRLQIANSIQLVTSMICKHR